MLASQFINEAFAQRAGLPDEQMGLGHAFEIDKSIEDRFLLEIAQAQLVRQIFPRHPIKWMPPTKHKTGDIFWSHRVDAMFDLVGVATEQTIELLGMMTEAIHTPLLQDRYRRAQGRRLRLQRRAPPVDEITWNPDGRIVAARQARCSARRASCSTRSKARACSDAIGRGAFADVKRTRDGGRGLGGVVAKAHGLPQPDPRRARKGSSRDAMRTSADAQRLIRAYGDRKDDGRIQLIFTLPVPPSGARQARRRKRFAEALGLQELLVATMEKARRELHVLRRLRQRRRARSTSPRSIVPEVTVPEWGFKEIDHLVHESSAARWSWSAPAPAPTRTPSASTPSST